MSDWEDDMLGGERIRLDASQFHQTDDRPFRQVSVDGLQWHNKSRMTFNEIGEQMGISGPLVRYHHGKAIEKIHKGLKAIAEEYFGHEVDDNPRGLVHSGTGSRPHA